MSFTSVNLQLSTITFFTDEFSISFKMDEISPAEILRDVAFINSIGVLFGESIFINFNSESNSDEIGMLFKYFLSLFTSGAIFDPISDIILFN